MVRGGRANNFVHFSPNSSSLWIDIKLDPAEPWAKGVEDVGLEYRNDWTLRVKITPKSFADNAPLQGILQEAVVEDEK